MNKLENTLDNILLKLDKIIDLLEKSQVENSFGSHFDTLNMIDAIGEEMPLPSPWVNKPSPTCKNDVINPIERDILYKKPEKPNWYNIKDKLQ